MFSYKKFHETVDSITDSSNLCRAILNRPARLRSSGRPVVALLLSRRPGHELAAAAPVGYSIRTVVRQAEPAARAAHGS